MRTCFLGPVARQKRGVDNGPQRLHCEYMSRSFLIARLAAGSWQFPARKDSGRSWSPSRHSPHATRHFVAAFTLIELLVVIAIIAILAALTLSTLGYVNKKGAESRATAEVAALSAAIESFKLDSGAYPADAAALYSSLCPAGSGKVYFEATPRMVATNAGVVQFVDPWDAPYGYTNRTTFFELWSTAGGTNINSWIRN